MPEEDSRKVDQNDFNVIITEGRSPREWQCIECGHVVEATKRPSHCPNCNCVNGDFGIGVNVMVRREAVGWFE